MQSASGTALPLGHLWFNLDRRYVEQGTGAWGSTSRFFESDDSKPLIKDNLSSLGACSHSR